MTYDPPFDLPDDVAACRSPDSDSCASLAHRSKCVAEIRFKLLPHPNDWEVILAGERRQIVHRDRNGSSSLGQWWLREEVLQKVDEDEYWIHAGDIRGA